MENILKEKIEKFNPDENGLHDHGIFGLPFGEEESELIIVPVPWEATVSYGEGTSNGPKAILDASQQIDLSDNIYLDGWKRGIAMQDIPSSIFYESKQVREKVSRYLDKYVEGEIDKDLLEDINKNCESLNSYVRDTTNKLLKNNKIIGLVGGDHSTPFGFIESLGEVYKDFGILHIDAHSDLRPRYEELEYSHASIFYNILKNIKSVTKLVQVGIRDISKIEKTLIDGEFKDKVSVFYDQDIKNFIYEGGTWAKKCDKIIKELPKNVYISFDIDGLNPSLCPNTGTPVPGGFTIEEMVFLFEKVISSGRKIIGFDLCEVSSIKESKWDGNVGTRVLYKLCLLALKSRK